MRCAWLAGVLAAVACAACSVEASDRPQVNGGGGGGGVRPGSGGGTGSDGGTTSTQIRGHVCVVSDLRAPTGCATPAGAGLAVTAIATGATTTTDDAGAFTLDPGAAGATVLQVGLGGAGTVPTITSVTAPAATVDVPIADATALTQLETELGTVLPDGTGMAALHLVDASGAGVLGYTITPPPGTTGGPFYDDDSAIGFANGGTTGAAGTTLLVGVPEGTFDIAFSNAASEGTFASVPIVAGSLTFATATIGTF